MINDVNQGVCSYQDLLRVQEVMRHFIHKKRPEFDNKWLDFCARSNVDREIIDGVHLSASFMVYCREKYIERLGGRPRGSFADLFSVFRLAFLPCGWDGGPFPEGDLLIF
jgi:hypothetical protein